MIPNENVINPILPISISISNAYGTIYIGKL